MSRIGQKPIPVPGNVKINMSGGKIAVEGPKGKLEYAWRPEVDVIYDEQEKMIKVTRKDDSRAAKSFHGLTRALIANMVVGVTEGYSKTIEIYGTGFGVKQEGNQIAINVGFANTVKLPIPAGVTVNIETPQSRSNTSPAVFTLSGPDKQVIGEFAAEIRSIKPPEPYNGKGIRYKDEHIRRKVGKALAGAGG